MPFFTDHLTHEDDGSAFVLNVRSHAPKDAASHHRRILTFIVVVVVVNLDVYIVKEFSCRGTPTLKHVSVIKSRLGSGS